MWWFLVPTFAAVVFYAVYTWRCLSVNIAAAKRSGFPYVVTPVYTFNRVWLITHKLWFPLLRSLPKSWMAEWLDFLDPEWVWQHKFTKFEKLEIPIILVISPGKSILYVADADAITQITSRRNDFPKPIELYDSVTLFGINVVSTEGNLWRHHRKITSPPFTEKSNVLVFHESIKQGQSMLAEWLGTHTTASPPVHVAEDAMRLSLHVISRAGFGVNLLWPHEEAGRDIHIPEGHQMSYKDALSTLLEYILLVLLLPKWFLKIAPFKATKKAYTSFVEWGQYMQEMYEAKRKEIRTGGEHEGLDLMGALVKGSGMPNTGSEKSEKVASSGGVLSREEILGNAFVFILAGHETAANTIHFALLYLAMNPASQRRVQEDLDRTGMTAKPPSDWEYETDLPKLFGGMIGAVMNEELRLIPPVVSIPKCTRTAQPLTVAGRRCIVPDNTLVNLLAATVHRNPAYWASPPSVSATKDLNNFRPERWLVRDGKSSGTATPQGKHVPAPSAAAIANAHTAKKPVFEDDAQFGGPGGDDTAATLLHPTRGSYIPFSEGARSCLGRRFAQVEILAVLAVILREYSVELAVDQWASDKEVEKMPVGGPERKEVWGKARSRAEDLLEHGMRMIITIQMRTGYVPMRFVKRGGERFDF